MTIHCQHTNPNDVALYDALFAAVDPKAQITHDVRPDLLHLVQSNDPATPAAVTEALANAAHVVLCTCTSLAPFVPLGPRTLSITHGAMAKSCDYGPDVLVVLTKASLQSAMQAALLSYDPTKHPRFLICDTAPPIAQQVRAEIDRTTPPDCILLAQASLRTAAPHLNGDVPVLTTPELAVQAALEKAST